MESSGTVSYGDLRCIRFEVVGFEGSGLLMSNPAGMGRSSGTGTMGPKHIPTPEEEAEARLYRLPSGQLYLPSTHFRGSILGAATGQKIAKKSAKQILAAGLFSPEEFCLLYHPETGDPIKEYEIDIRRAVVQRQGISRARPKVPVWACKVAFEYEPLLLNPTVIKQAFDLAGAIMGVGDFRPAKGGPFGRFFVDLLDASGKAAKDAA